jgi:starvation-inducible DNA-binding protein
MHKTKNNLPLDVRTKVAALINQSLADLIDLKTQTKQAHWNVKGPNFIALHKLFDEIADAVDEYTDVVAERAVQLGGTAEGTARVAAKRSSLPEYPLKATDSKDHVDALSTALAKCGAGIRDNIDASNKLGDADAADIFTEISRGLDMWLWFVESHQMGSKS